MAKGFEEFKKELAENQELYDEYEKKLQKLVDERAAESGGEIVALAAKELGYDVSPAELERDMAGMQELDLDEMTLASGGAGERKEDEYGHDLKCLTLWHCQIITCHTETKSHEAWCFQDYKCMTANEDCGWRG